MYSYRGLSESDGTSPTHAGCTTQAFQALYHRLPCDQVRDLQPTNLHIYLNQADVHTEQMFVSRCPHADVREQMSDSRCPRAVVREQMSESRCPRVIMHSLEPGKDLQQDKLAFALSQSRCPRADSARRCPRADVREQMSESRCPRADVREQMSES